MQQKHSLRQLQSKIASEILSRGRQLIDIKGCNNGNPERLNSQNLVGSKYTLLALPNKSVWGNTGIISAGKYLAVLSWKEMTSSAV